MKTILTGSGIFEFIQQSDIVGRLLLATLILMSILCWGYVVIKMIFLLRQYRCSKYFMTGFSKINTITELQYFIKNIGVDNSLSNLSRDAMIAYYRYLSLSAEGKTNIGSGMDFVAGQMQNNINQQTLRAEGGLVCFATIASTSPFIGLLGTVWGIYHALQSIGQQGDLSLQHIAGPVSESLIMTGIGLAIAVPAVVAYNIYIRCHYIFSTRLNNFATILLPWLFSESSFMPDNAIETKCLKSES
ncbi:MotA/TolQ/ExbB proton channel family protein [Escherichia albertii]|nr:MotA/TolQ/ExbB proton channel family protein [Escherichia albertii]